MKLYALHDKKSESLSAFQVSKSDAGVTRDFAQAVLEPKSMLGKYPDDFELVQLAHVNDDLKSALFGDGPALVQQDYAVVVTARQVLDMQPVPDSRDAAQLRIG